MAASKKKKAGTAAVTLKDIAQLGPKKVFILLLIALAIYFLNGNGSNENFSDIIPGTVSRVVDGDTVIVKVEGQDRRVRLLGVDTPETVHPNKPVEFYGPEASSFTKRSLAGKAVWLEYDVSPLDRYKRHLAYIWLKKPDSINENAIRRDMFNAKLLLGGYAKVMNIKPNSRYADFFARFQSEAQEARKGLWHQ